MANINIKGPVKGARNVDSGFPYILLIMFLMIGAGFLLSGGPPIDPTGPKGPPTLEPYFNAEDHGLQRIISPSGNPGPNADENLQLKTFHVAACSQKRAVYFLIDTSGSMSDDNKMEKTKLALQAFSKMLGIKAVVGMATFSKDVDEKVALNYFGQNKKTFLEEIEKMKPDGWTRTRDGFQLVKGKLSEAITKNQFPGYSYSLVLMTDGVPEIPPPPGPDNRDCYVRVYDPITAPALRCFAKVQDPRIPTNLATEIKGMGIGVSIYSIGIYSDASSDKQLKTYLEPLLQQVATQPTAPFYQSSLNADNLAVVLENICDERPI